MHSHAKKVGAAVLCASVLSLHGANAQGNSEVVKVMASVQYKCSAPNADTVTNVSVGAVPIVSNGTLYAADEAGIFKKHGLSVEFKTISSVPATISAVQGGAVDFAFGSTFSSYQAIDKGIDLVFVAPFAGIAPGYWKKMQAGEAGYTREITALLVPPNSGIDNPGQLTGKVVAVADAKGQAELATRAVIKKHGGDPSSVRFVVMNFPDAVNALMAGQIDAAYSAEPAILKAEKAGYKIISWVGVEALEEGPTSALISSSKYVLAHPEVAARFNCAIREATAIGRDNPDLVRKITAQKQGVDPATLATAVVPYFYSTVDMEGLKRFLKLQQDAGFVGSNVNLDNVVIPQALSQ